MLKVVIVILLICVIASLMSGLFFLFKDTENPDSKRLWYALGVRVTFATLLLASIAYGFYTGELRMGINAPWHGQEAPGVAETMPEPSLQPRPN